MEKSRKHDLNHQQQSKRLRKYEKFDPNVKREECAKKNSIQQPSTAKLIEFDNLYFTTPAQNTISSTTTPTQSISANETKSTHIELDLSILIELF